MKPRCLPGFRFSVQLDVSDLFTCVRTKFFGVNTRTEGYSPRLDSCRSRTRSCYETFREQLFELPILAIPISSIA